MIRYRYGIRYGRSIWEIGHQWHIDMNIDVGYGISIWDTVYRYGKLPYRDCHPGYRCRIWANDMGDDSIDMVISHVDMGYLLTLVYTPASSSRRRSATSMGSASVCSKTASTKWSARKQSFLYGLSDDARHIMGCRDEIKLIYGLADIARHILGCRDDIKLIYGLADIARRVMGCHDDIKLIYGVTNFARRVMGCRDAIQLVYGLADIARRVIGCHVTQGKRGRRRNRQQWKTRAHTASPGERVQGLGFRV